METMRECAVCSNECKFKCGGCHARFYCGEPHQSQDWLSHRKSCYPVKTITEISSSERRLIATRSIKALEIIYTEKPLVYGPVPSYYRQSIKNGCPICYKVCNRGKFSCPKCSIIMCSTTCHKHEDHIPECSFLRVAKPADRRKLGDKRKPDNLILLFRCLWLKHADQNSWKVLLHIKNDATEALAKKKDKAVEKLKYIYKLDNFTEEEINSTLIAIRYFLHLLQEGQACIYPTFYLLGDECSENTLALVKKDKEIVVKAACDIERNEVLSQPGVFPFYGVHGRRLVRKNQMTKTCFCDKCQDPTDMTTYMSSIYCRDCKTGHLLPPILLQEDWRCESCNKIETNSMVEDVLNNFKEILDRSTDVESLNQFLENSKNSLCENNYWRLQAKYNLCGIYVVEMMANPELIEKFTTHLISLTEEIVNVLCKVCPEYVSMRGQVYFHTLYPVMVKLNKVCNEEKLTDGRKFYKLARYIKAVYVEDPYENIDRTVVFATESYIQAILKLLVSHYSKNN